jgi:hypothetical protein
MKESFKRKWLCTLVLHGEGGHKLAGIDRNGVGEQERMVPHSPCGLIVLQRKCGKRSTVAAPVLLACPFADARKAMVGPQSPGPKMGEHQRDSSADGLHVV